MSEMVELVARAIWEARRAYVRTQNLGGFELEEWGDGSIPQSNNIWNEARAAIEAMREPTDEMLAALKEDWWDNETPLTVWQAMIDGALAKPAA